MPSPLTCLKVALGGLILVLLTACGMVSQLLTSPPPPATATPTALPPGYTVSGKTRGDPNAKVTLVVFSDFQWPYCKDFAVDAGRRIDEEYVKTGKIKFVYKYFPVLDRGDSGESHRAAFAAECASEQNKFWEYHDKLFVKWLGENVGMYRKPNLKKFAIDLKLDTGRFNECLDSDKYASSIQDDIAEGRQLQVRGTPTFFVNGNLLQIRSLDYQEFQRLIDPYLR